MSFAAGDEQGIAPRTEGREALPAGNSTWTLARPCRPADDGKSDQPPARRLRDVIDTEFDRGGRPYILAGLIGAGGMGRVHLAHQRTTGREVAIKVIKPALLDSPLHDAFRAECRVTAGLEHPNIPPVYDAGDDFMVMKRLAGESFEVLLERRRTDPDLLAAAVDIILKVCDALSFAHSRGVIHRDIKGDNVLVGPFGQVWLMDWGLAAAVAPGTDGSWHALRLRTRIQACAGTPMCLAPEVALGEVARIGLPTDLFMLGGLLYRVLGGRYPFHSRDTKRSVELAARASFKPLLRMCPDAPFRLMQAAERAMAWEPGDRGTVAAFADDLRTWLRTSGAATQAEALLSQARRALAEAEGACRPAEAYARYCLAIGTCERALGLCPEQRAAHELRRRAREGFSRAALAGGDLHLARMITSGFVPSQAG